MHNKICRGGGIGDAHNSGEDDKNKKFLESMIR